MVNKKVFIVAEIGINHNGDMKIAEESIKAAAEAGADSVKFQSYKTEDFITNKNLKYKYFSKNQVVEESQFEMFKRCELDLKQLNFLYKKSKEYNLDFHSTPTNIEGINHLKELGCEYIKNGSDYLTHLELIKKMGESGLTTIISTGMANLGEIDDAVRTFKSTGNSNLILLVCTSSYPTPPQEVNLSRISSLREIYNLPIGFSDHTNGVNAAIGAVFQKAIWIEKHFTIDKNLPGPDHRFSLDPKELKFLVNSIRESEQMNGSPHFFPTESEKENRNLFRLSCVTSKILNKGHILKKEDIYFCRPGLGMPPKMINFFIGRKLKSSLSKGHILSLKDFL